MKFLHIFVLVSVIFFFAMSLACTAAAFAGSFIVWDWSLFQADRLYDWLQTARGLIAVSVFIGLIATFIAFMEDDIDKVWDE